MTTEKDHNLMSTLLVSTVYPEEGRRSTFVEVATIKSPYSFSFEDGMSTRYKTCQHFRIIIKGNFDFIEFNRYDLRELNPQVHHRDEELHIIDQADADGRADQVDAALPNGDHPRPGEHSDIQSATRFRQHRNTL